MLNDNNSPLVSVCIITYNSRNTVLETLDSINAQSYPRLELIISDDCSTDDTVEICQKWMDVYGNRFITPRILCHEQNGGVAKNLNRAIFAASGEWVKIIAGDDLLLPDCVMDNIEFVANNPQKRVVFSKAQLFQEKNGQINLFDQSLPYDGQIAFFTKTAEEQYKILLNGNILPAPTLFLKRELVLEKPFPETYCFCEDYPQWLIMTRAGIKLEFLNKITVLYRFGDSLYNPGKKIFINAKFHDSNKAVFYGERLQDLMKFNPRIVPNIQKEFFLGDFSVYILKNRRNIFTRAILFLVKLITGTRKIQ